MNNAQPEMQIVLQQSVTVIEHLKTTVGTTEAAIAILAHALNALLATHFNRFGDEVALLDYLNQFKSATLDAYFMIENKKTEAR